LNLLFVPLIEGDFLLHLPDLYHELAHPLLAVANDPALEPFQNAFYSAADRVMEHLEGLERREDRRYGPRAYGLLLQRWVDAWIPYWLTEFFCDAFAACTVGPAYVWAHLHLIAKRGDNPFEIWDAARNSAGPTPLRSVYENAGTISCWRPDSIPNRSTNVAFPIHSYPLLLRTPAPEWKVSVVAW
jgi:hypothetical protein